MREENLGQTLEMRNEISQLAWEPLVFPGTSWKRLLGMPEFLFLDCSLTLITADWLNTGLDTQVKKTIAGLVT